MCGVAAAVAGLCRVLGRVCHVPQQSPDTSCRSVLAAQGIDPACPELSATGSSGPVLAQLDRAPTRAQTQSAAGLLLSLTVEKTLTSSSVNQKSRA